ncbi:MAG: tail fiber domain-containing protein [Burkholderiales bacterium]
MRRLLPILFAAAMFTLSSPARAQFCPGISPWVFDDVAASDPFCGYITWMAQNGITLGCQVIDANHRLYCPDAAVSRAAMAAFMNRLGNVRVEAVDTGPGLTGGPITSVGTIGLATTQLLPTTACATSQVPKWNGSAWACSADANSGGTVTSVGSGTGLAGGPITGTGTLSIAAGYQLPQGCTNGQVAKSSGAGSWTCANDVNSGGTVTSVGSGTGLAGGPITGSGSLAIATGYQLPQSCANGQVAKSNGAGSWTCAGDNNSGGTVTSITAGAGLSGGTITTTGTLAVDPASTTLTSNFFRQGGNAFGGTALLGTDDSNALDIRVNGARIMRYQPDAVSGNVVGGSAANSVNVGVHGATIAGGGRAGSDCEDPVLGTYTRNCANVGGADYSTVGGGLSNVAGDAYASVGGGRSNTSSAFWTTVAGGHLNTASAQSATVGGGELNAATNGNTTVGGGSFNIASGGSATVGGGYFNEATGNAATVPGGQGNHATGDYSLAAGLAARAMHSGSFVWADALLTAFSSIASNEFAVRATGGMRVVLGVDFFNQPAWTCSVVNGGSWSCSSDRNQKQNLERLDGRAVLDKVAALPLYQWNPKGANAHHRHYGPTAQDFYGAFGLGGSDLSIGQQDADGVALAAIQGLNEKLEAAIVERDARIDAQSREIAELRRTLELLLARIAPDARVAALTGDVR